jgi:TorA maturation chaperone TorD
VSPLAAPITMQEDLLRAQFYGLLAQLFAAPPDADFLARLQTLGRDDTDLGQALGRLADAAATERLAAVEDEFNTLFVGLSRGELLPYGSYYQTGFLHDKPLALLRTDLAALSIAAAAGSCEPEDHVATLCEIMQGLIEGRFGSPASLATQQIFFEAHLAPWLPRFFADLESSPCAVFYAPVGTIGRLFVAIETDAFRMLD